MLQWPAAEPADCAGEGAARTQDHQQAGRHGLQVPPYTALAFFCWCRQYHPSLLLITALCLPHSHSPGSFLMVLTGPSNSGLDQRSASTSLIHMRAHKHAHTCTGAHALTQTQTLEHAHTHILSFCSPTSWMCQTENSTSICPWSSTSATVQVLVAPLLFNQVCMDWKPNPPSPLPANPDTLFTAHRQISSWCHCLPLTGC